MSLRPRLTPLPPYEAAKNMAQSIRNAKHQGIKSMDIQYPWAPVRLPPYKIGTFGRWQVRRTKPHIAAGFYLPREMNGLGYALFRKERGQWGRHPWMSFTKMEEQSHMAHIYSAHGVCVVAGLGMGMYLYNIIAKHEVTSVIVIEKDQHVIDLFLAVAEPEKWPGWDKVKIVCADVLDGPTSDDQLLADHFYADIWPKVFDDCALPQSKIMFDKFKPQSIGWWTMEGDFAEWAFKKCAKQIFDRDNFDALYKEWAAVVGMPVVCQDVERMGSLCCAAMVSSISQAKTLAGDGAKSGQLMLSALYLLGAYKGQTINPYA